MRAGAEERDLVLVNGSGDTTDAAALRRRFGFEGGFKVVLVGKDGGEKLAASHPLGPDELFPVIDAMPTAGNAAATLNDLARATSARRNSDAAPPRGAGARGVTGCQVRA